MIENRMDFGWGKLGGTCGARCGARVGYRSLWGYGSAGRVASRVELGVCGQVPEGGRNGEFGLPRLVWQMSKRGLIRVEN